MTDHVREMIRAYRQSHSDVTQQVSGFAEEDLLLPSGSSEWNVAQVLSHLGSSSEIALSTLSTGASHPSLNSSVWARWDEMAPTRQAREFLRVENELVETLEAFSDEQIAASTFDLGFLPMSVDLSTFVWFRLSEVGLHRWDVDVAVDDGATLASYLVPILLNGLPPMIPMLARPQGLSGVIGFEITDTSPPRALRLLLTGESASIAQDDDATRATVTLSPESFVRLANGRLGPAHTPDSVRVRGDLSLDEIRHIFPGY